MWSQGLASQFCEGIAGKDEPTRSKKTKWTLDWNDLNLKWLEMTRNVSKWLEMTSWLLDLLTLKVDTQSGASVKTKCEGNMLHCRIPSSELASTIVNTVNMCEFFPWRDLCLYRHWCLNLWRRTACLLGLELFVAALPFLVAHMAFEAAEVICSLPPFATYCKSVGLSLSQAMSSSFHLTFLFSEQCACVPANPKWSLSKRIMFIFTSFKGFFETISFRIRSGRAPEEEGTLYLPCGMCGARHFPKQWLFVSMCNFRLETKNEVCGIYSFIWTSIASFGSSSADVSPNCLKFSLGKP